ncbi:MAG: Na+/H+ antiporter subunit E [Nitrospinota bacterium]
MLLALTALILALIWGFLRGGEFGPADFFAGLLVALVVLAALRRTYGERVFFVRLHHVAVYIPRFLWQMVLANLWVARLALRPRLSLRPGIVAFPTRARSDVGITTLANSITLTPGTMSVDVSEDRSTIFVHTIDIEDPEGVREGIRRGLEDYSTRAAP